MGSLLEPLRVVGPSARRGRPQLPARRPVLVVHEPTLYRCGIVTGVTRGCVAVRQPRGMRCERGPATIEWVGLVLLASLALGALAAAVPVVDGRSFGGFLSHRIVCAVTAIGLRGPDPLAGVRERRRRPACAVTRPASSTSRASRRCRSTTANAAAATARDAPDDRDLDAHRTHAGRHATVFTHVIRRNGRTYLQYWLYYPDSNSTVAGSDALWRRELFSGKLAQLPRLPRRRLGGPRRPHRSRRPGGGALDVSRPLAVVQVRRLSRSLGSPDRLDAGLAGEPRGARAVRAPGRESAGAHDPQAEGLRLIPAERRSIAAVYRGAGSGDQAPLAQGGVEAPGNSPFLDR